jgi:hypothetical protein
MCSQVVERLGVVATGMGRPHRLQQHLAQPGLSRHEGEGSPVPCFGCLGPPKRVVYHSVNPDTLDPEMERYRMIDPYLEGAGLSLLWL